MVGEKIKKSAEVIKEGVKRVGKRNIAICTAVLLVAAAVCINWVLYSGNESPIAGDAPPVNENVSEDSYASQDSVTSYFASVQISRQQARDEAREVLQLVIDSENAIESAKAEAIADVSRIADEIASEANIETLIKSKGFEECIAVISDDSATVIVKTDGLLASEVAQINEIVYEQSGILPTGLKIIEKK